MDEQLKPCPFCGGAPEITTRDVEPQGDPWYGEKTETFVLCRCGACLFNRDFHEGYDTETRAVKAWNRRAALAPENSQPVARILRAKIAVPTGLVFRNRAFVLEAGIDLPDGTLLFAASSIAPTI